MPKITIEMEYGYTQEEVEALLLEAHMNAYDPPQGYRWSVRPRRSYETETTVEAVAIPPLKPEETEEETDD